MEGPELSKALGNIWPPPAHPLVTGSTTSERAGDENPVHFLYCCEGKEAARDGFDCRPHLHDRQSENCAGPHSQPVNCALRR